jgi:hypothetical protein
MPLPGIILRRYLTSLLKIGNLKTELPGPVWSGVMGFTSNMHRVTDYNTLIAVITTKGVAAVTMTVLRSLQRGLFFAFSKCKTLSAVL